MADPYIGEIRMTGFNFAPTGWATCDGQLLPISQYTALFSLLGTQFGGNGTTNFALPDLRGRVPVHQGQGPGLSPYVMGEVLGVESLTLTTGQMPAHTHAIGAHSTGGDSSSPTGHVLAASTSRDNVYSDAAADTALAPPAVAGGNQPHENRQPLLCVNFIIALQGIFPSHG